MRNPENKVEFEDVVQQDPTLKYLLRDAQMDYDKLEHQMKIRGAAIHIAIMKWININY